jgi:hemerythrin-like domain-containing protein
MKTATYNLENDHIHILRLTEIMLKMVHKGSTNTTHIETVTEIIRNFADGLHHAKEENLLFPLLGERGMSMQQGPVAVMIHEHTIGREYVKGILDNLALYKSGMAEAIGEVYTNMEGYAELLQNHIGKENNILFRMADRVLTEQDQHLLLNQFEEIEAACKDGSKPIDYISSIEQLASIYLEEQNYR